MTLDGRLIAAILGFGVVLALSCRLRGIPSVGRCAVLAALVLLSVVGLELLGVPDERGVVAFLLGMTGAVFVGRTMSPSKAAQEGHRANWLAIAAIPIGLIMGLSVFGVWYWQTDSAEGTDATWYAVVSAGFGVFGGIVAGAVILLLDRKAGTQAPAEPGKPSGCSR